MTKEAKAVACKHCLAAIGVRAGAPVADTFSVPCACCGRRMIYSRDDLVPAVQRIPAARGTGAPANAYQPI